MRSIFTYRTFLVVFFLAINFIVVGQGSDIRTVNGEKFIVHEVKAGETLWAISQRYNVEVSEIGEQNPGALSNLSIGQVLLIPYDRETKKQLKKDPPRIENGDLLHTVQKGETLFSLYKRYNVEINDLIEANPELNDGLKLGMVVRIPMDKVELPDEKMTAPAVDDGSLAHQILKGETVYGISDLYDISAEELLEANGGLPDGLQIGAFIRIPLKQEPEVKLGVGYDTLPSIQKAVYKVAYLLPFSLALNDSIMQVAKLKGNDEFLSETKAAMHFYLGARMALDSLKAQGLSAEVYVKEVNDDPTTTLEAIEALSDIDLYIGPFHRNSIELIANKTANDGGHVVCPIDQSNKIVLGHSDLSKALSTGNIQIPYLARKIVEAHFKDNIILMEAPVWKELDTRTQMREALNKNLHSFIMSRSDSVQRCTLDKDFSARLLTQLDPEGVNVLVVPTNEVYYSSELMTRLSKLNDDFQFVVYGMESWKDHDNIDAAYKDKFRLHIPAASFIDVTDEHTKKFILDFRAENGAEPSEYAFLGYDITLYYLQGLLSFGTGFPQYFDRIEARPIHMGFSMKKTGVENGYLNENMFMLSYEGLRLNRIQ